MKKYIVTICWSVSVLAALFVGQAIKQPADYNYSDSVSNSKPEMDTETKENTVEDFNQVQKEAAPKPSPVQTQKVPSMRPASINSLMADLENFYSKNQYHNFDNYQNLADTWEKLKTLDEEQLYELYEQMEEVNEKGVNWNVARMLFSRMGELDPGRAIAFAVSKKQAYSVQGVLHNWSKDKPLEALTWITENKDSFSSSSRIDYYSLFNNVAKVDAEKALEGLKDFDIAKQRNALRGILNTLETNEDFLKVIGQFDGFEDKESKLSAALFSWGQKSPKDAIAFAQTIESERQRKDAVRKVQSAWVRSNPEEAANWILENESSSSYGVSSIVNNWDWKKSDSLYNWIQKQEDPAIRDQASYNLISRYSYNNAELSKKALETIESADLRKKAVTHIYRSLRYKNKQAAAEFLNGRSEVPEEEKEKLLSSKPYRRK